MKPEDFMLEIISGWRRKFAPDELTMLAEQLKQLIELSKDQQAANAAASELELPERSRRVEGLVEALKMVQARIDEAEGRVYFTGIELGQIEAALASVSADPREVPGEGEAR